MLLQFYFEMYKIKYTIYFDWEKFLFKQHVKNILQIQMGSLLDNMSHITWDLNFWHFFVVIIKLNVSTLYCLYIR